MIEKNILVQNKEVKAYLIGIANQKTTYVKAKEYLDELAFLAETANVKSVGNFIQNLDRPHRATYVGTGKLQEISDKAKENEIEFLIFDDELSPMQLKNIEKETGLKVLDRSSLILYIFSLHAQSAQAKLQVELAQNQYMLPRLTRLWTHLERQRGGTGTRGGAGEKEIETDRRILRDRISLLKKELEKIGKQNDERNKNRGAQVRVALVGYTNVGKSTIMNQLTKSDVLVENKLFATLDTTVRKVVLEHTPFLLSDTVGFIRKLPHHLVECFKSTLSEAKDSDILLHVVDVSHPQFEDHIRVVSETLRSVGIENKKIIMVFNKSDLLPQDQRDVLEKTWFAHEHGTTVFISATQRWNIDELRNILLENVRATFKTKYPTIQPEWELYQWEEGEEI
ncbi:MAG: GTPase HflX [Bacteroidia bacterium]|nr:GTPase HflX [Bacteroidia bacterium]